MLESRELPCGIFIAVGDTVMINGEKGTFKVLKFLTEGVAELLGGYNKKLLRCIQLSKIEPLGGRRINSRAGAARNNTEVRMLVYQAIKEHGYVEVPLPLDCDQTVLQKTRVMIRQEALRCGLRGQFMVRTDRSRNVVTGQTMAHSQHGESADPDSLLG